MYGCGLRRCIPGTRAAGGRDLLGRPPWGTETAETGALDSGWRHQVIPGPGVEACSSRGYYRVLRILRSSASEDAAWISDKAYVGKFVPSCVLLPSFCCRNPPVIIVLGNPLTAARAKRAVRREWLIHVGSSACKIGARIPQSTAAAESRSFCGRLRA